MSEPKWMDVARKYVGVREFTAQHPGPSGEQSNPIVEGWQKLAGIRRPDDEIPWCAAFVTAVMDEAGIQGFRTSAARAWARFGVELRVPRVGAVAVLWREDPKGPHGHVGFFVTDGGPYVFLLGGNQGNAVSQRAYPKARVIGYRWPSPAMLAAAGLNADGAAL